MKGCPLGVPPSAGEIGVSAGTSAATDTGEATSPGLSGLLTGRLLVISDRTLATPITTAQREASGGTVVGRGGHGLDSWIPHTSVRG